MQVITTSIDISLMDILCYIHVHSTFIQEFTNVPNMNLLDSIIIYYYNIQILKRHADHLLESICEQ